MTSIKKVKESIFFPKYSLFTVKRIFMRKI